MSQIDDIGAANIAVADDSHLYDAQHYISALEAENHHLKLELEKITAQVPAGLVPASYYLPITDVAEVPDRIDWLHGLGRWIIRSASLCLSRTLIWGEEPRPGSSLLTAEWYHQNTYSTPEEAYSIWRRWRRSPNPYNFPEEVPND